MALYFLLLHRIDNNICSNAQDYRKQLLTLSAVAALLPAVWQVSVEEQCLKLDCSRPWVCQV